MTRAIVVHGGAGALAPERREAAQAGCARAAAAGFDVLRRGGTALDAAIAATIILEDDPTFNAGTGAVLTREGLPELDAGLMDGATLAVGAVIGLRRVRNPITLAHAVLQSPEVLYAGEGAEAFAQARGLEFVTAEYFQAAAQSRPAASEAAALTDPTAKHGTVGAVALDDAGHLAAAASTGGYQGKPLGRVGDTPIAGAGFYAEDGVGGVACTGMGEGFIRLLVARRVAEALERGVAPSQAVADTLRLLEERVGGTGGIIALDALGNVGHGRSTTAMPFAFQRDGMAAPTVGF